jgi:hypothetical protein
MLWAGGNGVSISQDESKYAPPESEIMIVLGSCTEQVLMKPEKLKKQ